MKKYDSAMGKYDAKKLKQYVQAKIETLKRVPVDKIIKDARKIAKQV
jgi:hypothetical protein